MQIFLGLLLFFGSGLVFGKRLFRDESFSSYGPRGVLVLLSLLVVVGSLFYYLWAFSTAVVALFVLLLLVFLFFNRCLLLDVFRDGRRAIHAPSLLSLLSFLAILAAFVILWSHQTTDAVRSPWDVVPGYFFLAVGVAVLFGIAQRQDSKPWIFFIPLTFLFLSIAWIVFPLGYGHDPFIHQTAERIIADVGAITPKSPYYIGQYVLVVFFTKLLGASVVWIDKLLVPLLAAFFLPWSIMQWRRHRHTSYQLPATSFLFLPFLLSPFTLTTPYALGLLFLVVLIFHDTRNTIHVTRWLLAIATLLIHPITGIPALIFLIIGRVLRQKSIMLRVTCFVFCSIAFPLLFLALSSLSPHISISFTPENFWPWISSLEWSGIYRENRFNAPLDLLYFYGFNIKTIFWFFVLTSFVVYFIKRNRPIAEDNPLSGPLAPFTLTFFSLLANFLLLRSFFSFDFLISYEQTDYADRILSIALLFLLPFFFHGVSWWLRRREKSGIMWRGALVAVFTLAITASLFLTYPQNVDRYSVSHAFNTSQADIDAVRWIDNDASGEDYIVLANQAVSAAAVREFGFKKYYNSLFFYPLPTGSPLYQHYLDMVYKQPTTETMRAAMDLTNVNRAYFVLNRYWTNFDILLEQAKEDLEFRHAINDTVFIFSLPTKVQSSAIPMNTIAKQP